MRSVRRPMRKNRYVRYVGDDPDMPAGAADNYLHTQPRQINPDDHRCASCGADYAPYGTGFPDKLQWWCREHIGEVMPEVLDELDKRRLDEVRRLAIKGAQYWLQFLVAADNGHPERCKELWKAIRDISVETSDTLKAIGAEKRGAANAAKRSSGSSDGPADGSPVIQTPEMTPERAS